MIAPVTIGVSRLEMESYTRRPIPGQENTVSARTEPVITRDIYRPIAVMIGISAFFKPCTVMTCFSEQPFARAVVM